MPGMDGLTAIVLLRGKYPQIAIVILTTFNEDELLRKDLGLGARWYLLKDSNRKTLFNTIRAVVRCETYLIPEIFSRLLNLKQEQKKTHSNVETLDLTSRELEVLESVAKGSTSRQISYRLGIIERTVKANLTNIYCKLGVDSSAPAVSVVLREG